MMKLYKISFDDSVETILHFIMKDGIKYNDEMCDYLTCQHFFKKIKHKFPFKHQTCFLLCDTILDIKGYFLQDLQQLRSAFSYFKLTQHPIIINSRSYISKLKL